MKIAIVYDKITKFGGAERILLALHEIWPHAPLYTAVYDQKRASWADIFSVQTSFLQKIPLSLSNHELFPFLTGYAFESFDFSTYDIVITITSADAKCIITSPKTLHICFCLTPTRYLFSGYREYYDQPGFGILNPLARLSLQLFATPFRKWDYIASQRPDVYLAISHTVASRIKKYYKREAQVIYPPVDTHLFKPAKSKIKHEPYFLIVSRLVPYKKIDYIIEAFNEIPYKLKIIGMGIDEKRLKNRSGKNIDFISSDLTDSKLCWYYQNCTALIFPGVEDFGLTVVEVQSCAKPVMAYAKGGAVESIRAGITGELYKEPTADSFIKALSRFLRKKYSGEACRQNASLFSKEKFQHQFRETVQSEWELFKQNI